jgi:hypothetical protein
MNGIVGNKDVPGILLAAGHFNQVIVRAGIGKCTYRRYEKCSQNNKAHTIAAYF